jgi:hypothetical protein
MKISKIFDESSNLSTRAKKVCVIKKLVVSLNYEREVIQKPTRGVPLLVQLGSRWIQ